MRRIHGQLWVGRITRSLESRDLTSFVFISGSHFKNIISTVQAQFNILIKPRNTMRRRVYHFIQMEERHTNPHFEQVSAHSNANIKHT